MRGVSSIARTLKLHFHTSFFPGVPSNVSSSYEGRETLLGDIALWKPDSDPERAKLVSSQEWLPISVPPWHSGSDWEEGWGMMTTTQARSQGRLCSHYQCSCCYPHVFGLTYSSNLLKILFIFLQRCANQIAFQVSSGCGMAPGSSSRVQL